MEGLDQGRPLRGQLQDVIDAANRANVAIYTVDAAGLRAVSQAADPAACWTRRRRLARC